MGLEVCLERGCAQGRSPCAGSLRVSLKHEFFPFYARNMVEGMIERASQPLRVRGWGEPGPVVRMRVSSHNVPR